MKRAPLDCVCIVCGDNFFGKIPHWNTAKFCSRECKKRAQDLERHPALLRRLYWDEGYTLHQIAELLGVKGAELVYWIERHDLTMRHRIRIMGIERVRQIHPLPL